MNIANVVVVMSSCELSGPIGHDVIVSWAGKLRRSRQVLALLVNIRRTISLFIEETPLSSLLIFCCSIAIDN